MIMMHIFVIVVSIILVGVVLIFLTSSNMVLACTKTFSMSPPNNLDTYCDALSHNVIPFGFDPSCVLSQIKTFFDQKTNIKLATSS